MSAAVAAILWKMACAMCLMGMCIGAYEGYTEKGVQSFFQKSVCAILGAVVGFMATAVFCGIVFLAIMCARFILFGE